MVVELILVYGYAHRILSAVKNIQSVVHVTALLIRYSFNSVVVYRPVFISGDYYIVSVYFQNVSQL